MNLLGEYSLALAVVVAAGALFSSLAAIRFDSPRALQFSRWSILGIAVLLSLSSLALLWALIHSDFTLTYVIHHTEAALPLGYKIAAFWAGQEGSLLLWAWFLAAMSVLAVARQRRDLSRGAAITTATLAAVLAFFAALMLFAANPFELAPMPEADGHGLNPMLQNIAMILHPPLLFLGYAGFTIPFALLFGALLSGKSDGVWLTRARPWAVFSWIALTVGIVLGAQWAYVELGWGGYWAWDPVENASLLPWLTGTALLHSLIAQQRRGIFKRWTASLTAATFILCVFGTYLTRSGIVQSVHGFGESLVGTFFLVFLGVITLASAALILLRLRLLTPEHELEEMTTREGLFLAGNVLLVTMTLVTLVGTILPVLSGPFLAQPLSVGQPFYNKVVLPMGLLLAALMALGPLVGFGKGAMVRSRGLLVVLAIGAIFAAVLGVVLGMYNPWALATIAIVAAVAFGSALDFARVAKARLGTRENLPTAVVRTLGTDHRRWAAQLVHLGVACIILGIAGSSLFNTNDTLQLRRGQALPFAEDRYRARYDALSETRRGNYNSVAATVTISDSRGHEFVLKPERRFYDKGTEPGQSASEVAIRFRLAGDIYVTLAGWEADGQTAAVQVIINPLVDWIWIGGALLSVGAAIGLWPRRTAAVPASPRVARTAPLAGQPVGLLL